ncbi:CaiB/BaiF CoA transferase family protein [Cumulibacter manganitolerans]|uniref:CaiB/BaiF CoA transferase family protein n=1 Tax=Cumulibacter manganitolerans TaxID=1884992 RepID=UPI001295566D|nr:CaiB/BaiF CoA-transferase family protein [Cumulibacter manganitolerans]
MGPLKGIKVVEIASLAPAPMGTTILADLGAEVVLVDRPNAGPGGSRTGDGNPMRRNRKSITLDLKKPEALEVLLKLCDEADVFVEGFRPGVTERLGIGPEDLAARNPRLVYARMTGWGQTGPLAQTAGHDIDYIAMTGVLHMLGKAGDKPQFPANLIGDFGGGGMLMALGILAALVERSVSGKGQVVDAAMVDGAAQLGSFIFGLRGAGQWNEPRGENLLDGGAPFYDTYECADGGYVAVGCIEPQFYAEFLKGLQIDPASLPDQHDRSQWAATKARFAEVLGSRPRAHWEQVFEGTDACVAPILSPEEAVVHPANTERAVFTEIAGVPQPVGAPRFSRTVSDLPTAPPSPGQDSDDILRSVGLSPEDIQQVKDAGALG